MKRVTVIGANRVVRGGSWNNNGRNVRSAIRNRNEPDNRNDNIGFRLAPARRHEDSTLDQIVILSVALARGGKKPRPRGRLVGKKPNACRDGDSL